MGFGPDVERQSRTPPHVARLQRENISPFLRGLFHAPTSGEQNPFASLAGNDPRQQVLNSQFNALTGLAGGGGQQAAENLIQASQPAFQQNLQQSLGQLQSTVPSVQNAAFGRQGTDLTQRALQDFNTFQAQARQQGQQTALQAAGQLGQLGQMAGQARTEQFVNPTLRLLLGGMRFAQPIPDEVVSQPGIFSQLLGAGATVGGAALGGAFGGGGGG